MINFSGTHLSYYLPLYDRDRDGRGVLFGVVDGVAGDDALSFVVVVPARVHISVKAREGA